MNPTKFLSTMINSEDSQPKCFSISSAVPAGFFSPTTCIQISTPELHYLWYFQKTFHMPKGLKDKTRYKIEGFEAKATLTVPYDSNPNCLLKRPSFGTIMVILMKS